MHNFKKLAALYYIILYLWFVKLKEFGRIILLTYDLVSAPSASFAYLSSIKE